jgi:hypothetical protein
MKISPQRQDPEGKKKACFHPVIFLDSFDQRYSKENDKYGKIGEFDVFHIL